MNDSITVELYADRADPEETERLSLALRQELIEIDEIDSVKRASAGPPPPGSRGLDLAALGALAIVAKPTVEVLDQVFGVLRAWLTGAGSKPQTLRITVNGQSIELTPTTEQQEQLVTTFIQSAGVKA